MIYRTKIKKINIILSQLTLYDILLNIFSTTPELGEMEAEKLF